MHCVVDPCQFEGSMAYFPHNISRELLDIIRIDRDIMHPNGCNECPVAGWEPVWIAPGDACKLEALGPLVARQPDGDRVLDHCVHNPDDNEEFDDDGDWEDDFSPESHFKACLSISQINYLWEAGLCRTNRIVPTPPACPSSASRGSCIAARPGLMNVRAIHVTVCFVHEHLLPLVYLHLRPPDATRQPFLYLRPRPPGRVCAPFVNC